MKLLIFVLFSSLALGTTAEKGLAQESSPPGSIILLPGYHHRVEQGIDSNIGTIWKNNGLRIHYDIGELAGNYANCKPLCGWTDDELWRKKQLVNGREVICVFTNKQRLVVVFPDAHANFYAVVRTQEQLADMLFMLFTFQEVPPKTQ